MIWIICTNIEYDEVRPRGDEEACDKKLFPFKMCIVQGRPRRIPVARPSTHLQCHTRVVWGGDLH